MIACNECGYYHTVDNGCPTQEMIDNNTAIYDGTYEDQDDIVLPWWVLPYTEKG